MKKKNDDLVGINFDDMIERDYGPIGTPRRDKFEIKGLFLDVGIGVKERREKAGLSQEELAERSGLDLKAIKRIERGSVTTPIPNIHKVWLALGVPLIHVTPEKEKTIR